MDGDIAESDDITPFTLRVCLTKCLRKAYYRFTNHGELLK